MKRTFTLEYWLDEGWYVGRLKEVPGVFSQGETLAELEENIRDAYRMMREDAPTVEVTDVQIKEIGVEV
ncbi:MAG TPA: type II toxin-antitoxin system HicB family antitoxin [Bryobacteraceae bacterium]|nr:type II toxin-antitoxin system HicB family antitoxin [Bryobacteraceae bacterium]